MRYIASCLGFLFFSLTPLFAAHLTLDEQAPSDQANVEEVETNTPDISGKWRITLGYDDVRTDDVLTIISTPLKSERGQRLFMVEGKIADRPIWAASIEQEERIGGYFIAWYLATGGLFDTESNIILSVSTEEISLSGDISDIGEIGKMVKIDDVVSDD